MGPEFRMMGILNVTPDSFSDGGRFRDPDAAVAQGRRLLAAGADIIDIGGESTRPRSEPVGAEEEIERVQGVVARLATEAGSAQLSIDTSKAAVAETAIRAGATLVNDVTALRGDAQMAALVGAHEVDCCLVHMRGEPRTMHEGLGGHTYDDVVSEVKAFLEERLAFAVREGVQEHRILLDPGIGFGKTASHNLELLRRLDELAALGRPIVIGTSRKSFLGRLAPSRPGPEGRLPGTIATNVLAYERGASVFRVHDVAAVRDALALAAATLGRPWTQTAATTART